MNHGLALLLGEPNSGTEVVVVAVMAAVAAAVFVKMALLIAFLVVANGLQ